MREALILSMTIQRQNLGKKGEDLAEKFLKEKGYKIRERNFVTKLGEIDIIAQDKDTLCFVEVRTRSADWHGHPFESITEFKKRKLLRTALIYLQNNNLSESKARFDVVAVIPDGSGEFSLDLIQNAFEAGM